MVGGHREQVILSGFGLERPDDSCQIAVHFGEREAQLVRIRPVADVHEIRPLVVQQNEVRDVVFAERLAFDHGGHRVGFEGGKSADRRTAAGESIV